MAVLPLDRFATLLAAATTRRGCLALGGAAGLLALRPAPDSAARKRRRTKRKRKPRRELCRREGAACETGEGCCSGTCDFLVEDGSCAPCRGRSCSAERPCCGGLDCRSGFCDGCRDRATSCTADAQCCFSDCTGGACLSTLGGACARDVDCRSCYLNRNCTNACVNGACTV
jgi:hypothetical protein